MTKYREAKMDPASFRDPASRVYVEGDMVVREIGSSYFPEYEHLMRSGLYDELVDSGLLISHREAARNDSYITIFPERVPFISYPYEWNFKQLREAALNTLTINKLAMRHGMILKDASAFNMQVVNGTMTLIDTCSFTKYTPGMPWIAYSQFLRHFLCPMLLIKHFNPYSALKLLQTNIDGIPVPLASRLMPFSTKFNAGMWAHIFSQSLNFAVDSRRDVKMNIIVLTALLENLEKFTISLQYKPPASELLKYSELSSYTHPALDNKKLIVGEMIRRTVGKSFLDIGCNTGDYSRVAASERRNVIAVDIDHDCCFALYNHGAILPLIVDICQPSPGIGWANRERKSFWNRVGEVDCIMALAIIHHLCIKNNIPLFMVAELLKEHARSLIIEWVPPDDAMAQKILGKKNIPLYDYAEFLSAFSRYFIIRETRPIKESKRVLFRMDRK